ncbi:MAG: Y-family DNA polymerase [bacterium]|nr:Y-family DNA polymerase [bacterium]
MKRRIIALVDCDSFFVSCEQAENPELKGKPVCVLSNNDGCIVSRSKEAKALGIKMGMPLFMAKKEFPNAIYVSGHHKIYKKYSKKVMDCLKEFSPDVEIYSIDEAFVDLTGTRKLHKKNYIEIVKDIRNIILEKTDIPVSIGISTSKTLAKLASDKAKNTGGIYSIGTMKIKKVLSETPIEEVWGIGKNNTKALHKKGILLCSELIEMTDASLKALFGITGVELKYELMGEAIFSVDADYKAPKSIQDTSAFGIFTSDLQYIKKALNEHIHIACKKLRKHGGYCSSVGVMLRTKDFRVTWNKKNLTIPTNFELEISKTAMELLEGLYKNGVLYRATGIYLNDLTCTKDIQTTLFEELKQNENDNLAKTLDKLEEKFGHNIVRTGY